MLNLRQTTITDTEMFFLFFYFLSNPATTLKLSLKLMLMQRGILLQIQLYVPPFKAFIFNPDITSDSSLILILPLSPSLSLTQGLTLIQIYHNSPYPWALKEKINISSTYVGVNGVLCIQWLDLFSFCGTLQHPLALCALGEMAQSREKGLFGLYPAVCV